MIIGTPFCWTSENFVGLLKKCAWDLVREKSIIIRDHTTEAFIGVDTTAYKDSPENFIPEGRLLTPGGNECGTNC